MEIVFSLLPVLVFLVSLFLLDSFKLVSGKMLILCLIWGIIAALLSYHINTFLTHFYNISFITFSRYMAPLIEELMKIVVVIILLSQKKIGFTIDAAIYGFAAGTGFALAENVVYLIELGNESGIITWILRGFGTALMHGGASALFAMLLLLGIQRDKPIFLAAIPGLIASYMLHSLFNHFLLNPYLQTLMIALILPIVFTIIFNQSARLIQNWLEFEFSSEVELLRMIRQGTLSKTKAGNYLLSLKNYFNPETILDLYCYISLYLELSIKAKRNLMLKENGFPIIAEPDIIQKLDEMKQLRKQIGKMGAIAMQPLVRMKYREIWKLNQLIN